MDAQPEHRSAGFTRIELATTLAALALLGALTLPLLAATRTDSERAACFNNLQQIGRGVRSWANDHAERVPWLTPVSEGGTLTNPKTAEAWFEYISFSNEIASPRVLACPADTRVKVASNWMTGPDALALDPSLGPNAISYMIGLHAFPHLPRAIVSADRNIRVNVATACGPAAINNARLVPYQDASIGWTNTVHGLAGHLLLNDGSVEFTSSERLRLAIAEDPAAAGTGSLHMLRAR